MRRLLCTDLDRTLIPNGVHPESPDARDYLAFLVRQEQITLAYVTGRHRKLVEQAIDEHRLPLPDYTIADVGTTIYQVDSNGWRAWESWSRHLAEEWADVDSARLVESLIGIPDLCLQEPEKQSKFKVSFYLPLKIDPIRLNELIETSLNRLGVRSNSIWSVDEVAGVRLLDVVPSRANKLHAIRYLMHHRKFSLFNTLFAGDSGNDIDVLESDIPAVLVANADENLKARAARTKNDSLFVAEGGPWGMNGNYCAGILEGIGHYWPEVKRSLDRMHQQKDH